MPSGSARGNPSAFQGGRPVFSRKNRDFPRQNSDHRKPLWSIRICRNRDTCVWNPISLVWERIPGDLEWAEKRNPFCFVLLILPKSLSEQSERQELHRLLSTLLSADLSAAQEKAEAKAGRLDQVSAAVRFSCAENRSDFIPRAQTICLRLTTAKGWNADPAESGI